jgi:hypothetical protein
MVRKLILLGLPIVLLGASAAWAKPKKNTPGHPSKISETGKPSKFNPKAHSKPKKQKPAFKVKHGKIKQGKIKPKVSALNN